MKPPITLTDQQLRDYANEHLVYEIRMLFWTTAILQSFLGLKLSDSIDGALHNAILNSFSIHSRNLIDFLYSRIVYNADRQTDIVVEDYVEREELSQDLPQITDLLKDARIRASKQVAHITSDRLDYDIEENGWAFKEIYTDIMRALLRISHLFPERKTGDLFISEISKKVIELPHINVMQLLENGTVVGLEIKSSLRST